MAIRGFLGFSAVVLGLVLMVAVQNVLSEQRKLIHYRAQQAALEERLADLKAKTELRERYLARLYADWDFLERSMRRELGYTREGEVIFRFEEDMRQ